MTGIPDTILVSTILAKNIHCASCIAYIKEVFASFRPKVLNIDISILTQTIEVQHCSSLSAHELCYALTEAAFYVLAASTKDELGRAVEDLDFESNGGWFETILERWSSPARPRTTRPDSCIPGLGPDRKAHHLSNCESCRVEEEDETKPTRARAKSQIMQPVLEGSQLEPNEKARRYTGTGLDALSPRQALPTHVGPTQKSLPRKPDDTPTQYNLNVSIGGMTCASCSSAITKALQEVDYITKVEVSLMTNSAVIEYTAQENRDAQIVESIEDVGFDASVAESRIVPKTVDQSVRSSGDSDSSATTSTKRTVELRIDGMYCSHCSSRIIEHLTTRFGESVHVEQPPTLQRPIIKVNYKPTVGTLTIREIVAAVDAVDGQFQTHVYHPPSVEDRSQLMQAKEQRKIFSRLLLCSLVVIPTLMIGVIWMSVVPESDHVRKYLEETAWAGTVTRAQWALFIMATPVMFFAADVFHKRAIKEIRALWRRKSQVPILRRFYRFGSMNLLISAGTSVAYISSVGLLIKNATTKSQKPGHTMTYFDAVVFLTFFILIGKYLEAYSKKKTGNAVAMLGKLRPQEAILLHRFPYSENFSEQSLASKESDPNSTNTQRINVDLLEIGDTVLVPSGTSPPADGVIVGGSSRFNESALTGESREVSKDHGDPVLAGTVNSSNPVQVEVTGLGGTSMLDQIIAVVRQGQSRRAPVERTVDTVTGYFVPVITALAILTFFTWLGLGQSGMLSRKYLDGQEGGWAFWSLEFAIAVFVVACPCGIGLAAPTALFVGGGLAAKSGILVRGGGEAFQDASQVDAIVFDKTGTLTEGGNPTVTDHQILVKGEEVKVAWSITRSLEETSSHPLARAILQLASSQPSTDLTMENITEESGRGLRGTFALSSTNQTYEAALGSEAFITSLRPGILGYFHANTLSTWKSQSKSVAVLALREINTVGEPSKPWTAATLFAITDPIRPSAIPTISALQSRGIAVYMLTGDNPVTASAVASTLSISADQVFAGVLPTEKADKILWLKENCPLRSSSPSWYTNNNILSKIRRGNASTVDDNKKKKRATIAFLGDGINDAPALAVSDLGITLSNSTSIALSTASVILLSPSLTSLLTLLKLSEKVFRRIKFNFCWAMMYNIILVPVAAGVFFGIGGWRMGPVWGSAAMAGSSVCVVLSSVVMGWGWKGRGNNEGEGNSESGKGRWWRYLERGVGRR